MTQDECVRGNTTLASLSELQPAFAKLGSNGVDNMQMKVYSELAATQRLMNQQNLGVEDVDLFELHEAFAATVIKCQRDLNTPEEKMNVNGGVIALGHLMGATGAIMLGMLSGELDRREKRLGIVAASGAAGAGNAMLIERV